MESLDVKSEQTSYNQGWNLPAPIAHPGFKTGVECNRNSKVFLRRKKSNQHLSSNKSSINELKNLKAMVILSDEMKIGFVVKKYS